MEFAHRNPQQARLLPINPIPSIEALEDVLFEHAERLDRLGEERFDQSLPAPPRAGGNGIVPILHGKDLFEEGHWMNHCAASFLDRILAGKYYIYRVEEPSRATLGLLRRRGGSWVIDDLRGRFNKPVDDNTYNRVIAWWLRLPPAELPDDPGVYPGEACWLDRDTDPF